MQIDERRLARLLVRSRANDPELSTAGNPYGGSRASASALQIYLADQIHPLGLTDRQ